MISMFILYLKFGLGHTCVQGHIFVLDLDFWFGSYVCTRSHFCTWPWFLVRVIHVYKVTFLFLTLIFGLGHTCVQGHIFVLDLDFWLGSYMCTRSHFCSWPSFFVWVIHVYKVLFLYLTLIFGLGHTCVQGSIFVPDLDFWFGSYMCTNSHVCTWP